MRGFKIVVLTDHGRDVFQKTVAENLNAQKRLRWDQRMMFNKIWRITTGPDFQEWVQNPDSVRILKIHLEDIVEEVDRAMQLNGGQKGVDYMVEVYDE